MSAKKYSRRKILAASAALPVIAGLNIHFSSIAQAQFSLTSSSDQGKKIASQLDSMHQNFVSFYDQNNADAGQNLHEQLEQLENIVNEVEQGIQTILTGPTS